MSFLEANVFNLISMHRSWCDVEGEMIALDAIRITVMHCSTCIRRLLIFRGEAHLVEKHMRIILLVTVHKITVSVLFWVS